MATVNKLYMTSFNQYGGVPSGNATNLAFVLATTAGVAADSNQATALAIGDKVRVGILPAGTKLIDSLAIISAAFTAATTAKVGFEYVDGVDSAAVPQNDSYFHAALALSATGRSRANNNAVAVLTLPKAAYLIVTIAGAAQAATAKMDLVVDSIDMGNP